MNCKLLKLKSGEEIICDLNQISKTKYEIINPFIFKTITAMNLITGMPYEITLVKDWLNLTTNKKTTIPVNHIAAIIEPSPEAKTLYKQELNTKKRSKKVPELPPLNDSGPTKPNNDELLNEEEMLQFLQNIFGDFIPSKDNPANDHSNSTTPEELAQNPYEIYNEMFPPKKRKQSNYKNRPMIQMTMIFPPEVFIDLMETGIINVNDVHKIAKEVKKNLKFTGDERHRQDFGNKASDWNSDPKSDDYK